MLTQPVDIVPAVSSLGSMEDERRWFAVFTRSHHEKRVAQHYAERNIEHLLPVSRVERQWSHYRKVTIEMPLFPNYLFVHISRRERTRAIEVPGALSLVGQNSVPAPLPDVEIESLRESLKLRNCQPHPYLVAGSRVIFIRAPSPAEWGLFCATRTTAAWYSRSPASCGKLNLYSGKRRTCFITRIITVVVVVIG